MIRKIVQIDEDKCNGCGLCITACHEGALELVAGKAKLVADSYCDGLGACLPDCPTGAIMLEEREAAEFDEEAVNQRIALAGQAAPAPLACGCPGTHAKTLQRSQTQAATPQSTNTQTAQSELRQWPCQIQLIPVNAPYFADANLLIAADCTAYAYANVHNEFMRNNITLIGCPKLDHINYADKLTEILKRNSINSLTILRMEVPCCSGLVNAVKEAMKNSNTMIPWRVVTISTDGAIIKD